MKQKMNQAHRVNHTQNHQRKQGNIFIMDKHHESQSNEMGTSDHIKETQDYLEELIEEKLVYWNIGAVMEIIIQTQPKQQ